MPFRPATPILFVRPTVSSRVAACALIAIATLSLSAGTVFAQRGAGPALVSIGKVAKIRRTGTETFVGSLQPIRSSTVGSAVDGRVITMDLQAGDPVGADDSQAQQSPPLAATNFVGQPILQLRTGTLEIELGAAKIQLSLAEQAFEELKLSLPREIEVAQARQSEAAARLTYSRQAYERAQRLGNNSDAISQGELDQARSQFLADEQAAAASRVEFERMVSTRELVILRASLQVQAAQQELNRLEDLKAKYTIRAPFPGLITQKLTDVGEWVTRGQPLVKVVQLDPIEMVINVPQEMVGRLQQSLGDTRTDAPLRATIGLDGITEPIAGKVKRIVAEADLRSRTFPVRIELSNPKVAGGYLLQPGMLGRASMLIGLEQDMLVVKKDALVLGGPQPVVFKIVKQGDAEVAVDVPVKLGASVAGWIQVSGELNADDRIVLMGNERLRAGQTVEIKSVSDEVPPAAKD